jgi:hypothetical protein
MNESALLEGKEYGKFTLHLIESEGEARRKMIDKKLVCFFARWKSF